ncbi:hypothetical protein D3C71_1610120 [compost metagenome]
MNAALDDDFGIDLAGVPGKLQRIADDIGDAVENIRGLVIVRENDGVALLLQPVDGMNVWRIDRPLDRRNEVLHPLVEVLRLARDRWREGKLGSFDDAEALGGADKNRARHALRAGIKLHHRSLLSTPLSGGSSIMLSLSIIEPKQKRQSRMG